MVFITDARSVVGETRSAASGDNGQATGNGNGNGNSGGDMGSGAGDDTNLGIFTSDML